MKLLHKGLVIAVIPLVCQLSFVGLLGCELVKLGANLERVSRSKEIVAQSLDLVRTVLNDYYKMNMNSEVEGIYDPETTNKSCEELREKVATISTLAAPFPAQKANVAELSETSLALTKLLGWALYEQRQGIDHWVHVDEQCYQKVYARLTELLGIASAIVSSEQTHASYASELAENRRNLVTLLAVAAPVGILFSLLLGLMYAQGISALILRVRQNSRLLSLQKPLLPTLAGDDELCALDRKLHQVADSVYELLNKEKTLIANSAEIICSLDAEGIFRRVNESGEKLLGLSADELVGSSLFAFTDGEDGIVADEKLHAAARSAEASRFELKLLTRNGRLVETRWSVFWSESEKCFFCVFTDITEEKNIERLKQDFLDMIGLDLKAPLSDIQTTLFKLSSGDFGALSEAVSKELEQSQRTVTRLLRMVNNLLDFRRLESGEIELSMTTFKFRSVAEEALNLVEGLAGSKSIRVTISDKGESIRGDRDKLLQVVLNLLSNAIKFTPVGGKVALEARSTQSAVTVTVRDQGPGIPGEALEKIFESFEQTDTGREAGGTGLGLAICRMIVEAHHGEIVAQNEQGASGAVFTVSLPR